MIVDMHTHAGRATRSGPVDPAVLASLAGSGVAAAVVAAIADLPVLRRDKLTRRLGAIREPEPGECLASVEATLDSYAVTGQRIARAPGDIRPDDPALVLAIEGCDFLEGALDRLDAMEGRGVRSIQLTHLRVNETGDIQTEPEVHGGLTAFGAAVVQRMNRLGVIVDVTHCSEATVRGVAAVAGVPFLCTHSNLIAPGQPGGARPRLISPAYAAMVARSGGVVGASITFVAEAGMAGLIREILRLVATLGIDHVGIGTDLPSGAARHGMADFSRHGEIPGLLRAAGLDLEAVAKICGGNWLRVFRAVRA